MQAERELIAAVAPRGDQAPAPSTMETTFAGLDALDLGPEEGTGKLRRLW